MNELIGILIVLFIIFFPILQRILLKRHLKQQPRPREEIPLPKKAKAAPKRVVTERLMKEEAYEFHSKIEDYQKKTAIEGRHLKIQETPHFKEEVTSQAFVTKKKVMKRSHKLMPDVQMVIDYEIFSKPLALRSHER